MRCLRWGLALALLSIPACGPGTGDAARPVSTIPVHGKVIYKGKALTRGTVVFEPDYGRPARGAIQPDGSFVLTTYNEGDGAVPGAHRVSITEAGKEIPARYLRPSSSGIEIEITPSTTEYSIHLN